MKNKAGRPEKNTVTYFPYFVREGTKMFCIEQSYGNDGYATAIKLLAELSATEYHYLDVNKPATLMYLAAKCKVAKDVFIAIVSDLAELGKFDKGLWEESRIIWSDELIESLQEAYKKRSNDCIDYEGLLLLLHDLGIRKMDLSTLDSSVNTQTKLNKTKLNINIQDINLSSEENLSNQELFSGSEIPKEEPPKKPRTQKQKPEPEAVPEWGEVWNYIITKYPTARFNYFKAKYDSWLNEGWKDLKGTPIKNWKTKFTSQTGYEGALGNEVTAPVNNQSGKPKLQISI